jgi:uncharacterized membrane protein
MVHEMKLMIDVGGWFGAILLLLAYFLVSTKRVGGASIRYQSLNVVGSILVGANAFYYTALPSFSVNVVWIVIGVAALTRRQPPSHPAVDSER